MNILKIITEYISGAEVESASYKPTKPYTGGLPSKTIKKGSNGVDVKHLQKFLNWCINSKLAVDGICGSKSVKAIKKYQKRYGLVADGIFGEKSLAKAKSIVKAHAPVPSKPVVTNAQKVANQAIAFCGPKNSEKPAYKSAAKAVYGKGNDFDCHRFVGTVLKNCGYPKMPISTWSKILNYLKKNFTQVSVNGARKAGDIGVYKNSKGGYHIWIELGDGKKAEANHHKKYYPHQATSKFKKHSKDWLFRAK